MKKIFALIILALSGFMKIWATQTVTLTTTKTNSTIGFRINKVSSASTYKLSNTRYAIALSSGNQTFSTVTSDDNYWTVVGSLNGNSAYDGAYTLTLSFPNDDLSYLEITSGQDQIATVNISGAASTLTSLVLRGCTNQTTLTLGTMTALMDVNVANTNAAVANAITVDKCPNLQSLNVANCSLSSLAFTGTGLYSLDISGNSFTALDLSSQASLDILRCENNITLSSLVLPTSLTTLSAQGSGLTSVSGYGENLQVFDVASNQLAQLSVSEMTNTTDLDVSGNHLTFRSFPSAENKPARMIYTGNDGVYDITDQMQEAYGDYTLPLQSLLPDFSSRTDADYTIDMADARKDGNDNKRVTIGFENGNGTALTQAVSSVDGNDYTIDSDHDYYGFVKAQSQVRAKFTDSDYPGLTLYSAYFTVPSGVKGTLKIVDTDGSILYTKENAFFSPAINGLPEYARRDYTKYTIPSMPTAENATWTITAEPSDDAPFAWAKTYGSATWYYLGLKNTKWVTAGEQIYGLNGAHGYNGYSLKDSYDANDDNYYWAFIGNQYEGFKIVNKNRGEDYALQDYSGLSVPDRSRFAGVFPVLRTGEVSRWVVCTNSAGTGFSLKNKEGGKNLQGEAAPCFLNDFEGRGGVNYWITNDEDAQNAEGSLFRVTKAADSQSSVVKWVIVDENDIPIYNLAVDATAGTTVSAYPSELTTMASERFVTLDAFPGAFTIAAGENVKRIGYTWTGPFQISTAEQEYHYQLKIRNALYITSNTMSNGALDCVSTEDTSNSYRWMFFGDPFNGFMIRNNAKGSQYLSATNGTATNGSSYPTFGSDATRWIITSCMQTGYSNPFSISPSGANGVYWNQYGGTTNNQGLKYWSANGTSDGGAAIQAVAIDEVVSTATITWNVVDSDDNVVYTVDKDYALNSTVDAYPDELVALQDRFISYPALASFSATTSRSIDVPYSWVGPFELTTGDNDLHAYYFKSARYGYYAYAPFVSTDGSSPVQNSRTKQAVSARSLWIFKGDPFTGIEVHPYNNQSLGLSPKNLSTTPTKFIIRRGVTGRSGDYYGSTYGSELFGFVIPGTDESALNSCISEQLTLWSANSVTTDYGCNFVVEEADLDCIVESGYYRIRCVGTGLTDKYITMNASGAVQNTTESAVPFFLEEQEDLTWRISHAIGGTPYYFDNTRTSYSQQVTTTTDVNNAQACAISYDSKTGTVPFYRIKVGTFASYDGYSYMNINASQTGVVTWNYSAGTADGSAWALERVVPITLNVVGENSYATFYSDRDVQTDEDTKAYYITTVNGDYAQLTEVGNNGHDIPAYTAVVLVNDKKDTSKIFNVTSGLSKVVDAEDNMLKGTLNSMSLDLSDATPHYSLGRLNGEIGFYKFSGGTITLGANKAYLDTSVAGAGIKGFSFTFAPVDNIDLMQQDRANDVIYNLSGQRVTKVGKGIYIIGGRKVLIK